MSKREKELGIPSPAARRKVDPTRPARAGKPHKKVYPRHWEIRPAGGGFLAWDSKHKISDYYPWDEPRAAIREALNAFSLAGNLDAYLDDMASRYPETAEWPVRFISMQPITTTREVIQ